MFRCESNKITLRLDACIVRIFKMPKISNKVMPVKTKLRRVMATKTIKKEETAMELKAAIRISAIFFACIDYVVACFISS
jgi:hypothetical protein